MTDQLIEKYRPQTLDEIIGNEAIVKSIQGNLAGGSCPHGFLFTGNYGCGKTTFMEILARDLGATSEAAIIRKNAGQEGGVDDTRSWVEKMATYPLDGSKAKVLMVDECHELSRKAWTPLLTMVEKPPEFAYFLFATSEPKKVDNGLMTRVQHYQVETVSDEVIFEYLQDGIAPLENIILSDEIYELIATNSNGSLRQALSHFSLVRTASVEEARKLIQANLQGETHKGAFELAEMIFKHNIKNFSQYVPVIESICKSEKSTWGAIKPTLLNYGSSNMLMFKNLAMMGVYNDVKQMQPFFDQVTYLKAELIEVCACVCMHMP